MASYVRNTLVLAWLALLVATAASWVIGRLNEHGAGDAHVGAIIAILLIALVKVRLVMRTFMEVGHAPAWLQRICDAWLLANAAMILAYYSRG